MNKTITHSLGRPKLPYLFGPLLCRLLYMTLRIGLRVLLGKDRRDRFIEQHQICESFFSTDFWTSVRWGTHERPVSRRLKRLRGELFVDIGAGMGYYPLLLHRNFRTIVAFEPGSSFEVVREHAHVAGARNIHASKKAVLDYVGYGLLYCPASPHIKGPAESVTLASFFKDVPAMDLVKVDVEGGEWKVLAGSEPILAKIQRWLVELHDLERKREIEDWMRNHGYSFEWVDEGETTGHIYAWRGKG